MFKRKIIAYIVLFCVLTISVSHVPLSAKTDWSVSLDIEQTSERNEDGILSVRISISDITNENGIICAIYHLYFDTSCLELVSWENSYPEEWDFSGTSAFGAEDWTSLLMSVDGRQYLMYSLMDTSVEHGVTDDHVLYTDLKFKVKDENIDTSVIEVTNISFLGKDLMNGIELSPIDFELNLKASEGSTSTEVTESASESSSNSIDESGEESSSVSNPAGESTATVSEDSSVESNFDESDGEGKHITMVVTVEDIKDEAGVSSLQFKLNYNPLIMQFIKYECILPDNWNLNTAYTEDNSVVNAKNGELFFCIMNHEAGCGVKENGVLGFRLEFEVKNMEFDPSLITMSEISLINDLIQDMDSESYRLNIQYVDEDGSLSEDTFSPAENDGKTVKILVVVITCAVILGVAFCAFIIIRKKKLS